VGAQQTPVGGGVLYRTTDGGHSWQRIVLAPPPADAGLPATADSVTFPDPRDGVIGVRYRVRGTGEQHLVVYATADGGVTWSAHLAPRDLRDQWGVEGVVAFAAPTPGSWRYFAGRTLYATDDFGRSWRASPLPRVVSSAWSLSFSTPADGWVIVGAGDGAAFVRTADGGRTWTPVSTPPLPPAPPPAPPISTR
jgi:photosystem II stability/assembly factor-like uncharacterized protein